MKYILVHEETCALAIIQTKPNCIQEIVHKQSGFYILKEYPDNVFIKKYRVWGKNEDGRSWDGFIYAAPLEAAEVFKMIYPNDEFIGCVENEI